MSYQVSLTHLLGLGAGVAILLLGLFVLLARPRAMLNRAFFVLALFDGVSNLLFELREMSLEPAMKMYYMATWQYFFVAFVVLLAAFGLLFPRPLGGPRMRPWLLLVPAGLGFAALVVFALDHSLFYTPREVGGSLVFRRTDLGEAVFTAWPLAAGIVVVKLTHDVFTDRVRATQRQATLVLGGIVVAYGAIFLAYVWEGLHDLERTFLSSRPVLVVEYWLGYGGFVLLLVGLGARCALSGGAQPQDRRFLLGALAGAALLAPIAILTSDGFFLVQILSLLVYPLMLAYAIVSAEAFHINPQLRRATMFTLAGAGVAVVFITAEGALESYLQSNLLGFLGLDALAGVFAALVAVPMFRLVTRLANRFAPEFSEDVQHTKNLAVYRLTLEGALRDGMLDRDESHTLRALREALGVSEREHDSMVLQIRALDAPAGPHEEPGPALARG